MDYSISVVIPNYNGKELLAQNIPLVYRALVSSQINDYEIIISDDHSSDDSVAFIKNNYPDIVLISNPVNKGFGGNANNGLLAATKDLVFILNTDVELTEGYFKTLLFLFERPDTFGVMGRITGLDSEQIQDGAKYPDYSFGRIGGTLNYISRSRSTLYSLYMSGANALVDRKKIMQIGGFNELFNPYYHEDVDLGIRAWRMGYKVYYQNTAFCRHPNSATIGMEPGNKVHVISKRNKMYLHFLHLDGPELYYFLLIIVLKTLFRLISGNINYVKSFYLFAGSFPQLRKARKDFRRLQMLAGGYRSVKEVVNQMRSDINDQDITIF